MTAMNPDRKKIVWVRALYSRAHKIRSNNNLFKKQDANIKKVIS